jgi:hypothetical protein
MIDVVVADPFGQPTLLRSQLDVSKVKVIGHLSREEFEAHWKRGSPRRMAESPLMQWRAKQLEGKPDEYVEQWPFVDAPFYTSIAEAA